MRLGRLQILTGSINENIYISSNNFIVSKCRETSVESYITITKNKPHSATPAHSVSNLHNMSRQGALITAPFRKSSPHLTCSTEMATQSSLNSRFSKHLTKLKWTHHSPRPCYRSNLKRVPQACLEFSAFVTSRSINHSAFSQEFPHTLLVRRRWQLNLASTLDSQNT